MESRIPIIKRTALKPLDYGIILVYLAIPIGIWLSTEQQHFSKEFIKDFTFGYFFVTPIFLVGLLYKRLRNFYFFLSWVLIGLTQIILYPELQGLEEFQFFRGNAFTGMRSLLPTVIMYQILRVIFIRTHNMEMIVATRKYQFSRWDEDQQRKVTWLEVGFSLTLLATALLTNGADY
ncbi:MAG: hypothetical protein ABJG41_11890 [Cyclobacteriaceae bacterium]